METAVQEKRRRRPSKRKERCLYQDKRGRWHLDYYTPEWRRRRRLIKGDYEDAKAALAEIALAKKRGTFIDSNAAPTFRQYADAYLDSVSVHKESHEREQRLMGNLKEFFGDARLSKITRTRVIEYRKIRARDVKPATVNREIALLRHMFNVAIDQSLVAVNPARGGPGLRAFKESRRNRYLEMAEIATLLTAIDGRIAKNSDNKLKAPAKKYWQYLRTAVVVVVALHAGMRKGEILTLRWKQLNWEKARIELEKTKNGDPRRVPMDSIVAHELAEHRRRIKDDQDLVFPSFDRDGKVVPLADVKVSFGIALRDAGITDFRFHDLRHTFASHYVMSGGNLYTLAKILGHKDIKMTQRYADLSPDFIDKERERLDTLWTLGQNQASSDKAQNNPKYLQ